MKIFNDLRYISWRSLEMVKSDSIYNHLMKITHLMNDDDDYKNYIQIQLNDLLQYAINHTSFYGAYAKEKNCSLGDFPVVNKNMIMSKISDFQSDEFNHKQLHMMSTSGSTGRPFKLTQNSEKRKQVLAEILYFSGLLGYRPGKKFVYLRNLENGFAKSGFKKFLQNEDVISTQKYDELSLDNIVQQIARLEKDTTILGYASTLQMLAAYMERHQIKLGNVTGIISGAEAITSKTRKLVSERFQCPVVSRYSNQEMGILAQDNLENHFQLNRVGYYFELLDMEKDDPVPDGQMGRIVITDLYNRATPLIRYDTGDMGIMSTGADGKRFLSKVLGRKLDLLYTTKNEPLSFFAFDDFFENNYDIQQYQIIQEDRCHLTLNLLMKNGKTVDEQWCVNSIQSIMGDDCNVSVHFLDTVPITASGKFRYVICNYRP